MTHNRKGNRLVAGLIVFLVYLFLIIWACNLAGCASSKNGCGSYNGWESHTKYRNQR